MCEVTRGRVTGLGPLEDSIEASNHFPLDDKVHARFDQDQRITVDLSDNISLGCIVAANSIYSARKIESIRDLVSCCDGGHIVACSSRSIRPRVHMSGHNKLLGLLL